MKEHLSRADTPHRKRNLLIPAGMVLLLILVFSYIELQRYSRAARRYAESRDLVEAVDRVLTNLVDAETAQRGFLITGEQGFLSGYDQALKTLPADLATLRGVLSERPAERGNISVLDGLVTRKLDYLRQGIELRRTGGLPAAASVAAGKQVMDAIRNLSARIRSRENEVAGDDTNEGKLATETALLGTAVAVLALFFLFARSEGTGVARRSSVSARSGALRYGAALLMAVLAVVLRIVLTPLIGRVELAYPISLAAVLFAAWYGGLGPGAACTLISAIATEYYLVEPTGSLLVKQPADAISLFVFVVLGLGVSSLADGQRRAVERAARAEVAEREERERFQTTLTSIGDGVVATDSGGRVTFVNRIALSLIRRPAEEVSGKPLKDVFRIVHEETRATVESPVDRVLRDGNIVGLANHTVLIGGDGTETPIDDSAAPIRDAAGGMVGAVLVFRDISERRRAETAARLLVSIVESSDDAIISIDLDGIVTSWNRGAEHTFGYSASEMTGRSIGLLTSQGAGDEIAAILNRVRRGEQIYQYQALRRTRAGNQIHASITLSPLRDAVGRITVASKIVRDVSAQVEARNELAQQRERLRVTLSSIADGVITTDIAGRIAYLNPMAERLWGWTANEAEGLLLDEMFLTIDEKSRQKITNPARQVLDTGRMAGAVHSAVLVSRSGREISIDHSAAPILNAQKQPIGVVMVFRDVSGKRAAEEALRRNEERLNTILNHLPVGVALVDRVGNVAIANPVWKELAPEGVPSFDPENRRWRPAPGENESVTRENYPVRRALRGEDVLSGMDFLQLGKEGTERWTRISAVPLRGYDSAVDGALTLIQDIEQERRAEQQRIELLAKEKALASERALREMEADLARVVRALSVGELAASIAHEINQPISGVITNAETGLRWLSGEPPNIDDARESLRLIARDGGRASAVIRRIREYVRNDHPETVALDVRELILETLTLADAEMTKRGVTVRMEMPDQLSRIDGDRIQL